MSNTSSTVKDIDLNLGALIDTGLNGFRRAYAFMGFAVNMVNHPDLCTFEVPIEFIPNVTLPVKVDASDVTPKMLQQYKEDFIEWVIGNGLQELTEQFSLFLDEVYYYLQCAAPNAKQSEIDSNLKTFEGKNIHSKLAGLSKFNISTALISDFETIVVARNCLVHRGGIVGKGVKGEHDFNDKSQNVNKLRMEWKVAEFFVKQRDGSEETFTQGAKITDELIANGIGFRIVDREKFFNEGEKINLTTQDLSEICLNFRSAVGEILCKFFETLKVQGQLPGAMYNELLKIVQERISLIGAIYMKSSIL